MKLLFLAFGICLVLLILSARGGASEVKDDSLDSRVETQSFDYPLITVNDTAAYLRMYGILVGSLSGDSLPKNAM